MERRFQCKFCKARFVHEQRFLAHKCKQMIRDEEFRTPIGQAAWLHYQEWMKVHRRQVPRADSFLHSKYYRSFIRFAEFAKKIRLPEVKTFIWWMKEKDIDPVLWTSDGAYASYLEFIDRKGDPRTQAKITIQTIFQLADAANVDHTQVFDVVTPSEIIQLIRERRISPWLMLHSKKFHTFVLNATAEERTILETIIRPHYWVQKFQEAPDAVVLMKRYVSELKL